MKPLHVLTHHQNEVPTETCVAGGLLLIFSGCQGL